MPPPPPTDDTGAPPFRSSDAGTATAIGLPVPPTVRPDSGPTDRRTDAPAAPGQALRGRGATREAVLTGGGSGVVHPEAGDELTVAT